MESLLKLQNGSDIRGVALDGVEGEKVNLTQDSCYKIGAAFVRWLSGKTGIAPEKLRIGIGMDSRLSGPDLEKAVVGGMLSEKACVVRTGLSTTPAMFMSTVFEETKYNGSIMITASHLPFNRNGLKFFDVNGGLEHDDITDILEIAETIQSGSFETTDNTFDLLSLYSNHLKNSVCAQLGTTADKKPLSGLKIVVDAGNGCGGFFARILSELGADTNGSSFLDPDGHFPNHIPNPENKEAMAAIKNSTISNKADLGLIFDTDVDRMSCVLDNGSEVNRDAIIALVAAILAPSYPGSTIITDSVTSDRLTYFLQDVLKLKHLRYMRAYKNVINKCIELNSKGVTSPLAMETSGHGALKENYYLDDGAFLAVKIVAALAKAKSEGKKLGDLISALPALVEEGEYRFKIDCDDFKKYGKKVLETFKARAIEKGYILPESFEGVRLSFKGEVKGWILLRMSLHDPVMPLNIESEIPGGVEKLKEIARELISGFDKLTAKGF